MKDMTPTQAERWLINEIRAALTDGWLAVAGRILQAERDRDEGIRRGDTRSIRHRAHVQLIDDLLALHRKRWPAS